jgi:sialate O-acetylesterase
MALRCSSIMLIALLVVVALCCVGAADDSSALLRLPSFLSDHMVLQRGRGVVWGWAAPGEKVQATVKADVAASGKVLASASATAAVDGAWQVTLSVEAQLTSVLEVRTASASIVLQDVAWGDVFLCSGQSNMEYPMADAFNGTAEREAANYPTLRMLNLADRPWPVPAGKNGTASDCPSKAPYVWAASKPSTITPRSGSQLGDGPTDFSDKYPAAVCWYSARELVKADQGVPIGIICASKSGSAIESWMPEAAMRDGTPAAYGGNGTCGGAVALPGRQSAQHPAANGSSCPRGGLRKSGNYYRGMIAPLTKMRISAIWWYQGEANDHSTDGCPGPTWCK